MRGSHGNDREDLAAAVAAQVAAIFAAAELAILDALTSGVRRAIPIGTATIAGVGRLRRQVAVVLAAAERRARRVVEDAGVPWDYTPVLPALPPETGPHTHTDTHTGRGDTHTGAEPEQPPAPAPESLAPGDLAAAAKAAGTHTEPSIAERIEAVSVRVYRDIPDIYQRVVREAIESTRGGMPQNSLSLSRIQAAQKALDQLAEHGITGFTDQAGRDWDLLAYIEMATRSAVSNAYDNLQNAALIRGGHDLIWTITTSAEGSCPLCRPWLGKVLSLTGATTGRVSITDHAGRTVRTTVAATLAEARAAGFRHPNCRCSWIPYVNGADYAQASALAEPPARSAAAYEASQRQRAYERRIRRLGREEATALTPHARNRARAARTAAQQAAAAHRKGTGLRMTQVGVRRREHPHHAH